MTLEDFTMKLDGVRRSGRGWLARCPAHDDRSPSLSVKEGERGLLVKCWAGCRLDEITTALGIRQTDLFFDALDTDPHRRRLAAQQREHTRHEKAVEAQKQGRRIDALREAEYFVRARQGIDIRRWSDKKLDDDLNMLADAYTLLASENQDG